MFNTMLCNYHAPCGLCTYYGKPCSEVFNAEESITNKVCEFLIVRHGKTYCLATKECEECTCNGYVDRCDFDCCPEYDN